MKFFLILFVTFVSFLMVSNTPNVAAQNSFPSAFPFPSPDFASAEPVPTIFPTATPQASFSPAESPTPQVIQTPTPAPIIPIPPIVIPIITEPTPMPLPSMTPRPTIPLFFQIQTTPAPTPVGVSETTFGTSTYRTIVAPALSFVTQTNVEEFYKDQSLPEHTANLLYGISLLLMASGMLLSAHDVILEGIAKLRQKEFVQYLSR